MGRLFKCHTCLKEFGTASRLRRHKLVHTNEFNYLCDQCAASYKYSWQLLAHKRAQSHNAQSASGIYACAWCCKTYKRWQEMARHIGQAHLHKHVFGSQLFRDDGVSLCCARCRKSFTSAARLSKHLTAHDASKNPFRCGHCLTEFVSFADLRKHMLTDHGMEVDVECPMCGKSFAQNCHLQEHMKAHRNLRVFQCDQCPRAFNFSRNLRSHKRSRHSRVGVVKGRRFMCHGCKLEFGTMTSLVDHTGLGRCNSQTKSCSFCRMDFRAMSTLRWHVARVHAAATSGRLTELFTCSRCDEATFTGRQGVDRHIREVHLKQPYGGEIALRCSRCLTTFRRKSAMRLHLLWHAANLRLYTCCRCEQASFPTVRHLKYHINEVHARLATGLQHQEFAKAKSCSSKRLGQTRTLPTPKPGPSATSVCACEICNAGFPNLADLSNHVALHSSRSTSQRFQQASRSLKAGTSGAKSERQLRGKAEVPDKAKTSAGINHASAPKSRSRGGQSKTQNDALALQDGSIGLPSSSASKASRRTSLRAAQRNQSGPIPPIKQETLRDHGSALSSVASAEADSPNRTYASSHRLTRGKL